MMKGEKFLSLIVGAVFSLLFFSHGMGQELKDGMEINKNNYKIVEHMLFDTFIEQIVKYDLEIIYKDPVPQLIIEERDAQNKKYAGKTKLDMSTLKISGYIAGDPFPPEEIEKETDPKVKGTKIMWDAYYSYGRVMGDNFYWPEFHYVWIDGRKGVQRTMLGGFYRYFLKHRCVLQPEAVEPNPENIYFKSLIGAIRPYDLAGFGSLNFRFDDGRLDQSWAYLPAMRRIRRMAAGSWMDSVLGTDWTYDDLQNFDPYPSWYKGYNFIEKKKGLLMPAECRTDGYNSAVFKTDYKKGSMPLWDFENPPYWRQKDWYQPTDVYVVECFPPDEHPYGRRIHYVDPYNFIPYIGELYDKRGEYWKWQEMGYVRKKELSKGRLIYEPDYLLQRDIQTMHATACPTNALSPVVKVNDPNFKEEWFTQTSLINLGK